MGLSMSHAGGWVNEHVPAAAFISNYKGHLCTISFKWIHHMWDNSKEMLKKLEVNRQPWAIQADPGSILPPMALQKWPWILLDSASCTDAQQLMWAMTQSQDLPHLFLMFRGDSKVLISWSSSSHHVNCAHVINFIRALDVATKSQLASLITLFC